MKRFLSAFFVVMSLGSIPAFASISGSQQLVIDFTKPAEAKGKATWSDPDRIGVTLDGLGFAGQTGESRDASFQTEPLAIGTSWRPAQSAMVRIEITPPPASVTLDNGQKFVPFSGSMFVRYSADGKNWSSWQALAQENPTETDSTARKFSGLVGVPAAERKEYVGLLEEYQRLDVPWKSDEEALAGWIVQKQPEFFREHKPFIGYLQFLFESPFYAGQRISRFEARAFWNVNGQHVSPRDVEAEKDREGPWRFKGR